MIKSIKSTEEAKQAVYLFQEAVTKLYDLTDGLEWKAVQEESSVSMEEIKNSLEFVESGLAKVKNLFEILEKHKEENVITVQKQRQRK